MNTVLIVVTVIRQHAKMIDGKGSETANGGAGPHMALKEQRHHEPHTISDTAELSSTLYPGTTVVWIPVLLLINIDRIPLFYSC